MNRTQTLLVFIFLFLFSLGLRRRDWVADWVTALNPKCRCFVWPQLSVCVHAEQIHSHSRKNTLHSPFFSSFYFSPSVTQMFSFSLSDRICSSVAYIKPSFCFCLSQFIPVCVIFAFISIFFNFHINHSFHSSPVFFNVHLSRSSLVSLYSFPPLLNLFLCFLFLYLFLSIISSPFLSLFSQKTHFRSSCSQSFFSNWSPSLSTVNPHKMISLIIVFYI